MLALVLSLDVLVLALSLGVLARSLSLSVLVRTLSACPLLRTKWARGPMIPAYVQDLHPFPSSRAFF